MKKLIKSTIPRSLGNILKNSRGIKTEKTMSGKSSRIYHLRKTYEMLGLIQWSVLLCVTLSFLQVSGGKHDIWKKFKQTHSKDYHPHLENTRRIVFEANVQSIADHNIQADLGQASFKLGLNPYTDIPHDEFVKTVNGYKKSSNKTILSSLQEHQVESLQLPQEVDWVKKGLVSSVKNQGSCGSCWTFSTAGAVEGAYALKVGKLDTLSQQHLLDCSVTGGNEGCDGGEPAVALQWVVDNEGLNKEGCYSYKGRQGKCRPIDSCLTGKIRSYKRVPKGDEVALKEALSRVGPISIAIDASHVSLQNYDSGIYSEKKCNPNYLDHAILLVGYGTENGEDYWKIKNSWGSYWGEDGYFRMARNKGNMCGVATEAFYGVA